MTRDVPRIRRAFARTAVRKFERPQWNPRTRWTEKRVVIAFVELEDGTLGLGEAYCDGGTPHSVTDLIERDLAPLLAGQSPLATRHLWRTIINSVIVSAKGGASWAAASALDIACWAAAATASSRMRAPGSTAPARRRTTSAPRWRATWRRVFGR